MGCSFGDALFNLLGLCSSSIPPQLLSLNCKLGTESWIEGLAGKGSMAGWSLISCPCCSISSRLLVSGSNSDSGTSPSSLAGEFCLTCSDWPTRPKWFTTKGDIGGSGGLREALEEGAVADRDAGREIGFADDTTALCRDAITLGSSWVLEEEAAIPSWKNRSYSYYGFDGKNNASSL